MKTFYLTLFISENKRKRLIKSYKKQEICLLKFNRQSIVDYNCKIPCLKSAIDYVYKKTENNNYVIIGFAPIHGKKPKSDDIDDLLEIFHICGEVYFLPFMK